LAIFTPSRLACAALRFALLLLHGFEVGVEDGDEAADSMDEGSLFVSDPDPEGVLESEAEPVSVTKEATGGPGGVYLCPGLKT
jgi:hypothetical protein